MLALEDGRIFNGRAAGAITRRGGEVVFNTSLTGYQEVFTDPSYAGQIVCLTYPHIGNVGANISDVRISEADNLPRVTWVGEYFLISGEAGIKNDFAAAARDRAGRAAVKDAPVFQRENRG